MSSDMLPGYWTISAQLDDMRRKLDACTPYLKDGETPAERIQREVNDNAAVLDLLAKEKEALARLRVENEALRKALGAMLTHFGMDEDEWTKPTFAQASAALQEPKS